MNKTASLPPQGARAVRQGWACHLRATLAGRRHPHVQAAKPPWYAVPADDRRNARLIVSQVVVNALDGLKMSCPGPALDAAALKRIRKQLAGG